MKVVILAGGSLSNISEDRIPKTMLKVGERPLIWHIMKHYSLYGCNDFIVCTGYRSELIKEYFMNYYVYSSDITVDLKTNQVEVHKNVTESWEVTIVDTGMKSSTAMRVKLAEPYVGDETFLLTYGDCVSDIDLRKLLDAHAQSGKLLTLALAKPTGRNAIIPVTDSGIMKGAPDSSVTVSAYSNAYAMAVSPQVFSYIPDHTDERFEKETLNRLSTGENVNTYIHDGFWLPVETYRDHRELEQMWDDRRIPWRS